MESRDFIRPILAGLVGIGLIVLVIVLIVKALSGAPSAPTSQVDITKYASTPNASATLLIDGPTNVDQDHRQVKITVSSTENEIDIIQGYQNTVMDSQTYPNNSVAFASFLQALKLMNFSKGKSSNVDYRGYCPTGERYVYTFSNGENDLFTYWSTSCSGQGTFEGSAPGVRVQFVRQIPDSDFGRLTGSIPLGF
jgi:hypothetical protein